jgi:O-antigen/teichoic acid export membrane protein
MSLIGIVQFDSAVGRYYYDAESVKEKNSYVLTAFSTVLFFSLLVGTIGWFCGDLFSELIFSTPKYGEAFKIIAITVPVINTFNLLLIVARFDSKPWLFGAATIAQGALTIFLTLYFLIDLNYGLEGVFWANLYGFLIGFLILIFYYRKILFGCFDKDLLKKYFQFSIPLFPADLGSWLNNHVSKFLMILYLSKGQLGVFAAALKVASILKFGDYVFRMAWTPFYLKEIKKENHKTLFVSIFNKLLLFFAFGMIVFHFVKIPLSNLLFSNDEYLKANEFISPLAFAVIISTLVQVVGMGTIIAKKTIYNTYNFLISLSAFFIAFFILVPMYGIMGAVYSQLISSIMLLASSWYNSYKLYPINFSIKYAVIFIISVYLIITLF